MQALEKSIKYLLFATVLVPLIYVPSALFPFISGKLIYFRSIIEITLALFLCLLAVSGVLRKSFFSVLKQPLTILAALFFVSAVISTIFAVDVYGAFWGNLERGEGLFTMLHYFAFFLMAAALFKKKDWVNYVKLTLLAGLVVAFYALLQVAGIENFPFALDKRNRPWSFLGNASFLAGYFILILGLAIWVYRTVSESKFWKWLSLSAAAVSVAVIFLTATRGAIVALLFGLLIIGFYNRKKFLYNKFSLGFLGIIILFALIFGLTRSNDFWQKIPGLDRFAKFSFSQSTVQTRLIALKSSWEAFKENPVLGWGLENYSIAYNKHYNPSYALYEAAWFDRAHNKIADVLVMQGLLGLIFYLGIFGYAARQLIKNNHLPLAMLLAMYFIQNLFVFDHHSGYLIFFGVLGLAASWNLYEANNVHENKVNHVIALSALFAGMLIMYSLYSYNFIPFRQARAYISTKLVVADVNEIIKMSDKFLYPYNFAQSSIRKDWHDFLVDQDVFENPAPVFEQLGNKSLSALKEHIDKEPYDPRDFIRLAEAYNDFAQRNSEFLKDAEAALKKALELAPRRQEVYYHLAYTLAGTDRTTDAIKVAEQAVALSPEVARAHYMLGIILSLAGDRIRGEQEIEKAFELERGLFLLGQDYKNILNIYGANFVRYIQNRDLQGVRTAVKRLKEFSPEEAQAPLDKLLELAEQGRWRELEIAIGEIIADK